MIKLCKKRHNRMKPKRRIQSLKQLIKESQEVASKLPYYNKGKLIDPKVLEITGILTTEKMTSVLLSKSTILLKICKVLNFIV